MTTSRPTGTEPTPKTPKIENCLRKPAIPNLFFRWSDMSCAVSIKNGTSFFIENFFFYFRVLLFFSVSRNRYGTIRRRYNLKIQLQTGYLTISYLGNGGGKKIEPNLIFVLNFQLQVHFSSEG